MERFLRLIGAPSKIGSTLDVAGYLEISNEVLAKIRRTGGLSGPVLWALVLLSRATQLASELHI
jgi:N-acyl-L-homoserine lactone synthetase